MFGPTAPLAAGAYEFLLGHIGWFAAGVIVLVALIYGIPDLVRFGNFGWRRAWAISSVCFAESIRRRVLWITPLAILGVLGVAQFLDPVDPADAIRQTVKVCLFASGLLVTMTAIILACTNLPKEIDSRVIYTVVTKPTTRLEIVLGKVIGFARVSGAILLIMGVFTLAYVQLRAWRAEAWVREQAAANPGDPTLQNLARTRLLATRSLAEPETLNVYARPPAGGEATVAGGQSQFFYVPFDLTNAQKDDILKAVNGGGGLMIVTTLDYENRLPTPEEQKTIRDMGLPTVDVGQQQGALLPGVPSAFSVPVPIPQISLTLFDRNLSPLGDKKLVNEGNALSLPPGDEPGTTPAAVSPEGVQQMIDAGRFHVAVEATTPTVTYVVGPKPLQLAYIAAPGTEPHFIDPAPSPKDPKQPAEPAFQSHRARYGMQIRGKADGKGTVAAYQFRRAPVPRVNGQDATVTLETKVGIESATDFEDEQNVTPRMTLQVYNLKTKQASEPIEVRVESGQIVRTPVPARYVEGGDFDVYLRGLNEGMWYGVEFGDVSLVRAHGIFAFNLFKSLFILWMMAILVVIVAVFTSTFLSWPIAVVLTVVLLMGRWGVEQFGDASGAGIGTEVAQAMSLEDPTAARIVRTSVGALTTVLNFIAAFLPDLSKFDAIAQIERGVSIPAGTIGGAGWVLLGYGVPMLLLTYLILRNKEVAP